MIGFRISGKIGTEAKLLAGPLGGFVGTTAAVYRVEGVKFLRDAEGTYPRGAGTHHVLPGALGSVAPLVFDLLCRMHFLSGGLGVIPYLDCLVSFLWDGYVTLPIAVFL